MAKPLLTDRGLRPRALVDLQRGVETGRFSVPDADMALMMSGATLLGLAQLADADADADLDSAQVSDDYARHVLLMLGLDAGEADRLVALPLRSSPFLSELIRLRQDSCRSLRRQILASDG